MIVLFYFRANFFNLNLFSSLSLYDAGVGFSSYGLKGVISMETQPIIMEAKCESFMKGIGSLRYEVWSQESETFGRK